MLPNLIVIGARKCATTSLHHYLSLHPEIYMSKIKELNFFVKEMRFKKGLRWYESQFPLPVKVRGESSPNYSRHPIWKGIPERMYSVVPRAKLIYMVRDPVERLISAYYHDYKGGVEGRPFEEMIGVDLETNPYLFTSRYSFQLLQFLKYYRLSQILVVSAENLSQNPNGVMHDIFEFLGVDSAFQSGQFFEMKNILAETVQRKPCKLERFAEACGEKNRWLGEMAGSLVPVYLRLKKRKPPEPRADVQPPVVGAEIKERLREYFRTDIRKLSELTGQTFEYDLIEASRRIHSKMNEQAQQFGNAFKWKKGKE